jgi:hypothetical protein
MTFHAHRYPKDWKAISRRIRVERADNRCECAGECGDDHEGDNGRCDAPNGVRICRDKATPRRWWPAPAEMGRALPADPFTLVKVVLTVAHLDHDERNNLDSNLAALCQRCHLKLDARDNRRRRRENADTRAGQGSLPPSEVARG